MNQYWPKRLGEIFDNLGLDADFSNKEPWDFLNILDKEFELKETTKMGKVEKQVITKEDFYLGNEAEIKAPCRIEGPLYLGQNSVVGPYGYIRGPAIIDENCVIGSAEIKNSIIFAGTHAEHFAYIGDSVVGKNVNIGAGTIIANLRLDEKEILIRKEDNKCSSGREKFGAVIEDNVSIGANCVLNPGVYLEKGDKVYPGESI